MMAQDWTQVSGMELMKMVILLVLEREQDDMMVKEY